jgi:hypothetical protein
MERANDLYYQLLHSKSFLGAGAGFTKYSSLAVMLQSTCQGPFAQIAYQYFLEHFLIVIS